MRPSLRVSNLCVCLAVLATAAWAAGSKSMTAQDWLAAVPPLPATAEDAYAQWVDVSGSLRPGSAFEKVADGIKAQSMALARPTQSGAAAGGALSAHDQALVASIAAFPDSAVVARNTQAARTAQEALLQKWRAELATLEQHRLLERSALPACRNEAGAPSQLAIRAVELSYARQKLAVAKRYLSLFQPLVAQMKAAVTPRIQHADAAMAAWSQLHNAGAKTQLAATARNAQTDALQDVGAVQEFIEQISQMAAKGVEEKNAMERVYALAQGC